MSDKHKWQDLIPDPHKVGDELREARAERKLLRRLLTLVLRARDDVSNPLPFPWPDPVEVYKRMGELVRKIKHLQYLYKLAWTARDTLPKVK